MRLTCKFCHTESRGGADHTSECPMNGTVDPCHSCDQPLDSHTVLCGYYTVQFGTAHPMPDLEPTRPCCLTCGCELSEYMDAYWGLVPFANEHCAQCRRLKGW